MYQYSTHYWAVRMQETSFYREQALDKILDRGQRYHHHEVLTDTFKPPTTVPPGRVSTVIDSIPADSCNNTR